MCHGELREVFSLNYSPAANNFTVEPFTGGKFPLVLMECRTCKHVQLRDVLTNLFSDYKYRTPKAYSPHLQATAELLKKRYPTTSSILEIGGNNGLYTEILHNTFNCPVISVDPAGTHHATWKEPFNKEVAGRVYKRIGPVDLIVANNVFAHIDDLDEVFEAIDYILDPNGSVIIEVQDFGVSLKKGYFDMIYHEHLDQHRVEPWRYLLERHNLNLSAVEKIPSHGGSIRITATRHLKTDWIDEKVNWYTYKHTVAWHVREIKESVKDGCVAWGATAKLTTLIHHCDIADKIAYCVDTTPEKLGRYIPGTGIRIVAEFEDDADLVLLGAWNYAEEFKRQFPYLRGMHPYE